MAAIECITLADIAKRITCNSGEGRSCVRDG